MECTAGSHASPPPNRARFPATPFSLPEFTRLFLQGHTSCGGLSKSCSSVVHPQYQARPLIARGWDRQTFFAALALSP